MSQSNKREIFQTLKKKKKEKGEANTISRGNIIINQVEMKENNLLSKMRK
jgi:hypothetical protein